MSLSLPAATFTTYIPPTTPPLAQFTPAPTCYPTKAGDQMWHVTGICYPEARWGNPNKVPIPQCTYTRAGNPEENKPECGNRWGGPGIDEGPIGSCPVGFTSAGLDDSYGRKPFDRTIWEPTSTVISYDVTGVHVVCCPSISGLNFKSRTFGNVYTQTTTTHSGVAFHMDVPIPYCFAHPNTVLDGKTVTMGIYHDSRVFDKKKKRDEGQQQGVNRRQDWPWSGPDWPGDQGETTTAVFNARRDTIWADEVRYHYTVFHGTHTCYENCDDYFTNSYYNTDPNFTPPPPTSTPTTPSSQPSAGLPYPSGGGGAPPYPTAGNGYSNGNGAPYPTGGHGAPYTPGGDSTPYIPGGDDNQYTPGKDSENQGGNKPPVYSAKPPAPSSSETVVQSDASGMRFGGLAVLSTVAMGFLGLALVL